MEERCCEEEEEREKAELAKIEEERRAEGEVRDRLEHTEGCQDEEDKERAPRAVMENADMNMGDEEADEDMESIEGAEEDDGDE